jgi:predicted NBD/HSP70 family sugar kinase
LSAIPTSRRAKLEHVITSLAQPSQRHLGPLDVRPGYFWRPDDGMTPGSWHLGIDIGGTWVRLVAGGPDGVRLEAPPAPAPASYEGLLSILEALVPREVAGQVAAIGCGVPGKADAERPIFVPTLPWLEGKPLASDLSARLRAPAYLGTDGHFTLLAEAREGAATGVASAALVAVGTGIGGALMIGGRIWRGTRSTAGSWGWLPAQGTTTMGGHGPFEQVASGLALSQRAAALAPGWSGPELVGAARAGERAALSALSSYAAQLASGIAAIASVLDPELVLIAGGLSAAMDLLGPMLDERIQVLASPDGRKVPVRAAALGPRAGAVGALVAAQSGKEVWDWPL